MPDDAPAADAQPDAAPDTDTPAAPETDWKAEAEKWKVQARKHEERAKANATAAKELDQFRQASMSEQEKAIETARAEARAEAVTAMGRRLVDAEVRAAAKGRIADVDALLDGLDRARFLGEDGEPDVKAINGWVDRLAPKKAVPDLGQGARPNGDAGDMNRMIRTQLGRS